MLFLPLLSDMVNDLLYTQYTNKAFYDIIFEKKTPTDGNQSGLDIYLTLRTTGKQCMHRSYQLDLLNSTLGDYLACSDDFGNVIRLPKQEAFKQAYIAPNNSSFINCLLFDIDNEEAGATWLDCDAPMPNWICQNPHNGHAHYGYQLIAPVPRTLKARASPQRYLARIQHAMTEQLKADRAYSHFLTKTPEHPNHRTIWGRKQPYTLPELAEWLPDDLPLPKRIKRTEAVGEGRNVTLFDSLRHWAYRQRLSYNSYDLWLNACLGYAHSLNQFSCPLPLNEVRHTANSVAKWTWRNISDKGFSQVQQRRNKRSVAIRQQHIMDIQGGLLQ